jgi:hypothetical protein
MGIEVVLESNDFDRDVPAAHAEADPAGKEAP